MKVKKNSKKNHATATAPLKYERRKPKCNLCRNHGSIVHVKNHKRYCPFRSCSCPVCDNVKKRRDVMRQQIKIRRHMEQERQLQRLNSYAPVPAVAPAPSTPRVRVTKPYMHMATGPAREQKHGFAYLQFGQPNQLLPPNSIQPSNLYDHPSHFHAQLHQGSKDHPQPHFYPQQQGSEEEHEAKYQPSINHSGLSLPENYSPEFMPPPQPSKILQDDMDSVPGAISSFPIDFLK